jgi:SAM-dependent methyltransferase
MSELVLNPLEHCRVCGTRLQLIEKITHIPLDGSRFTDKPSIPGFYNSVVYLCPDCGLYQMPDINGFSDFYNFSNTKYIKSLNNDRKLIFEELISYIKIHQNILGIEDVGFSQTAERYFQQVITIDPEKLCTDGSGDNNHFLLSECSKASVCIRDNFDGSYIICPLAHVDNPLQIMQDIHRLLKEGGVGWIEVLNGETLISQSQYYNFMPILLNYWTPHSISVLLKLSGFETVMIRPGLGGDHLNVFFRKPQVKLSLVEKRDRQANLILNKIDRHKKTVIWGAGAKAHYLFGYLSEKLQVSHIVDGSPAKEGLYMPGAQIPVEKPSKKIFQDADMVIIFAASYEKEITKDLRERYKYTGKVFCLSEN